MRTKATVVLENYTPLKIADMAIGRCWDKQRPEDVIDVKRMYRVGNKFKHASTLEHIVYNFTFKNISRALLQELARHRIASFSVKSTRYTLNDALPLEGSFVTEFELLPDDKLNIVISDDDRERARSYIFFTGDRVIDDSSIVELEILRRNVKSGKSNDIAKYNVPEAYLTEVSFSINMRSLQNLLNLRTTSATLQEFRELSTAIYEAIPLDHTFMFTKFMHNRDIYAEENVVVIDDVYINSEEDTVIVEDYIDLDDRKIVKFKYSDTELVSIYDEEAFLKEFKRLK